MATNPHVFSPDLTTLRGKLQCLLRDGPTKLKIVSDFDSTLSTTAASSWCAVEQYQGFSDHYRNECRRYGAYYYPKETDPALSWEERVGYMLEWMQQAAILIQQEAPTRENYNKLLLHAQKMINLRPGCAELFELTQHVQLNIPVLIFSAGIGDIIDSVLLHHFAQYYTTQNPFYPLLPIQHKSLNETELKEQQQQSLQLEQKGEGEDGDDIVAEVESHHHPILHPPLSPQTLQQTVEHNPGYVVSAPRNVYIIANHFDFCAASEQQFKQQQQQLHQQIPTPSTIVNRYDPTTFRADDVICGFDGSYDNAYIHVFNKHEVLVKKADYYAEKIAPRTNVLLLGDSLGDSVMIDPHESTDNVIRVAFLNTTTKKTVATHLNGYLKAFDIVFVDSDDGIGFCNTILRYFDQQDNSCAGDDATAAEKKKSSSCEVVVIDELLQHVVEQIPQ